MIVKAHMCHNESRCFQRCSSMKNNGCMPSKATLGYDEVACASCSTPLTSEHIIHLTCATACKLIVACHCQPKDVQQSTVGSGPHGTSLEVTRSTLQYSSINTTVPTPTRIHSTLVCIHHIAQWSVHLMTITFDHNI